MNIEAHLTSAKEGPMAESMSQIIFKKKFFWV